MEHDNHDDPNSNLKEVNESSIKNKVNKWIRKKELLEVRNYFIHFLKNPIHAIKTVPEWTWPIMILIAVTLSAASSFINGVISQKLMRVFMSLTVAPIAFIAVVAILSAFFYYTFFFFFNRQIMYKNIYAVVIVSTIPTLVTNILTPFLEPIAIIGLGASSLLLIVGLVENFQLPRTPITRLIAMLFIIYTVIWVIEIIDFTTKEEKFKTEPTKEALDILEGELKSN